MWNLFKEVFRSLFKNKAIVIGLSILIFLTSGIFTVLYDTSKAMRTQFNNYKKISVAHDLTVDYNLPASGQAFNDGYYINGETKFTGGAGYDKGIRYVSDDAFSNKKIIDFNEITDRYINISNFFNDKSDKHKYILKNDFSTLYNTYSASDDSEFLDLDYTKPQKKMHFKKNYLINLYQKNDDGSFSQSVVTKELHIFDKFHLDKQYKFSDIAFINSENQNNIYFSQLSALYINADTHEATFDFVKGKQWELTDAVVKVENNELAKLLGLVSLVNNPYVYIIDGSNKPTLYTHNKDDDITKYISKEIKANLNYSDLFSSPSFAVSKKEKFEFTKNADYLIPNKWAKIRRTESFFLRKEYEITYDKENQSKWTGSYRTFLENQIQQNNGEVPSYLKHFSFWEKEILIYNIPFVDSQNDVKLGQKGLIRSNNPAVSLDEINHSKLSLAPDEYQPTPFKKILFILDKPKTIAQIENRIIGETNFNELINKNILGDRFNIIKNGALDIVKHEIYNQIQKYVPASDIGIRQSITVDSFDEKDSGKNVFHFVNLGDRNQEINGIANNIDKLVNEQSRPTQILNIKGDNSNNEISSFFKTKEVNPFIAFKIIDQLRFNVEPIDKYIHIDREYAPLEIVNSLNGDIHNIENQKIYHLTRYQGRDDLRDDQYNQFINLGFVWLNQNDFYLTKPVYNSNKKILNWINVEIPGFVNGKVPIDKILNYLTTNNLTVQVKLNTSSYVEKSDQFSNTVYIPFGYRAPQTDVLNQAFAEKSLKLGVERIEQALLNTDLVTQGFIQKETIYSIVQAATYTFDKNDFASIFSSGLINLNILPKLVLDGLYYMSHDPNGDFAKKLFVDIFEKIYSLIEKAEQNHQTPKEFIKTEIKKLFNFIYLITGKDIKNTFDLDVFIDFSNDIKATIKAFINIIKTIDFKKFTDIIQNFFETSYNKTIKNPAFPDTHSKDGKHKLSIFDIIIALLKSIDSNQFKTALISLLDTINPQLILNIGEKNNIFTSILGQSTNLVKKLTDIIFLSDDGKSKDYTRFLNGIKFFIRAFDTDVFIKTLEENLKISHFETERSELDIQKNVIKLKEYQALSYLTNSDLTYATLKAWFNVPGSDRVIKTALAKMLNLSFKGQSVEIGDNQYVTIPAKDDDKLDFFDLLDLLQGSVSSPANSQATENTSTQPAASTPNLSTLIENISQLNSIDWQKIPSNILSLAYKYLGLANKNQVWNKEKINNIVQIWHYFFDTFGEQASKNSDSLHSFFKLANAYINQEPNLDSNVFLTISYSVISKLLTLNYKDYNYLIDILPLLKVWWELFNPKINGSLQQKQKFANDLLALANQKDTIDSFNSFELFLPSTQNIVGSEHTKFGITRSLANPKQMQRLFFAKDKNGKYSNKDLQNIVNQNPEFENFLSTYAYEITKLFSYIASEEQYAPFDKEITEYDGIKLKYNTLFSTMQDVFVNKVITDDIIKHYYLINNFFNQYSSNLQFLDQIGIPPLITNKILIRKHPQALIWLLTDKNNIGKPSENDSNVGYFLINKIIDFEQLLSSGKENTYEFINSLLGIPLVVKNKNEESGNVNDSQSEVIGGSIPSIENDFVWEISIDNDFFVNILNAVTENPSEYKFFDINLGDVFFKLLNSLTGFNKIDNILVFNQSASYLAKVNYAYMLHNHKEIYDGELPVNPIEMLQLIDSLPEKYKINVNGSKYLIIGDDISFDYFYPVLDENNLQVDTKSQAIVYVNNKGFDRIHQAYRGSLVKEYLTVKNTSKYTNEQLKNIIEKYVQSKIDDTSKLQRTYLYNELDPINPERSIRISSVQTIITTLSYVSNVILAILVFLVTISVTFIIKRYIANKNKVIGILVAQGYTPLQISLSMTTFAFFTIFTGNLLGYITGFSMQSLAIKILDNYWTVPIETLNFSIISFLVNIIVPLLAMSILIIVVSLRSLRYKSIDLMSGIVDVSTGESYQKYIKVFKNRSVKTKFGASLIFNSFWKLASFGISVILASITTSFGFATFGIFNKTIDKTYENRKYNYKIDLTTPTTEGGSLKILNPEDVKNSLYVPIGRATELNAYQADYFKNGYSTAINVQNKNGEPTFKDPHLITQFSINIKIDSSISIDPFSVVFQSLPDVQKSRIIQSRDQIGYALTKTQKGLPFKVENGKQTNNVDFEKAHQLGLNNFFLYVPSADNIIDGKFFVMNWSDDDGKYNHNVIKTTYFRDEYRAFLVNGYEQLAKQGIYDFDIVFNGVYLDPRYDETYTYVDSQLPNGEKIRLYGYRPNSKEIAIKNGDQNLLAEINNDFANNNFDLNKDIPLVINEVSARKYHLAIGSILNLEPKNLVYRFQNRINKVLGKPVITPHKYRFVVKAINQTYIKDEFIIPKKAADKLIGLDSLVDKEFNGQNDDAYKFNGILSTNPLPIQLIWSANLYSVSGYSGSIASFSTKSITEKDKKDLFDGIFGSKNTVKNSPADGAMAAMGYSDLDIAKFLDPDYNPKDTPLQEFYQKQRNLADIQIEKFAKEFDNQLFIPVATGLDSKQIEISFTQGISRTVQIIVTIITVLSFLISIIILIIISTILINENEKNIAIWSILGYNNKEKLKMFFGIYIPFIVISIIISLPFAYGLMVFFANFLATGAAIAIPLSITPLNFIFTASIIFGVFLITAILSWYNINKIKAIDLLKGK
ncbi:ABC transporter permease [Mycoplasma sp. 4013]